MKFLFKAKSLNGEIHEGIIESVDSNSAIAMLQEKGLVPIMVEKEKEVSDMVKDVQHLWENVNLRELSVFFRQLGTLLEAKVTIVSSLVAVSEQMENRYLKTIIGEMVNDIEDGMPLSEAMSKHPIVFKNLTISMIKAGELSGNLQKSIVFLAENNEKNYELNSKIKTALFYPIFVFSAALIIGFIVFTVVLPKLSGIFKDMNVVIPWYTKVLMGIGAFMGTYWWIVALFILLFVGGSFYYIRTEDGKREWDLIKMKIPIVGSLFKFVYVSRFSENFSVLLAGGIPIVKALIVASEIVGSTAYESVILRAADEVKTGGVMSNVFAHSPQLFPPIVSQMIRIGEETGKVSEVLKHVATFYTQETDRITRNMSSMLEPILITALGAGVAVIVFAVLIPIYSIATSIM